MKLSRAAYAVFDAVGVLLVQLRSRNKRDIAYVHHIMKSMVLSEPRVSFTNRDWTRDSL